MAPNRRPRSTIEGICTNVVDEEDGTYTSITFTNLMWMTMRPSSRGAFKVPRQQARQRKHHWKGRIVELKQGGDGKKLAKVQHVYTLTQLKLAEHHQTRFPANCKYWTAFVALCCSLLWKACVPVVKIQCNVPCVWLCADIFPSNFYEWETIETFSGTFEAIHIDYGRLLYAGCSANELAANEVFFYDATYEVPRGTGYGNLIPMSAPTVDSLEWPIRDALLVASFRRKIECDVKSAMKCTYGSHRATLTWFVPIHMFVSLFKIADPRRTPTMWIAEGVRALQHFLPHGWDTKVVLHQDDTIKCAVISDKVIVRYHISKQQLSMVYPYRRWKYTNGEWQPLDSDVMPDEQVDLHLKLTEEEKHHITAVNADWSRADFHEYIACDLG